MRAFSVVVGLVSTVLVLLNPDAVIDALGGTRRSGLAIVGAFVVPPVMVVLGIVFPFVWVHRFRVRDGGVVALEASPADRLTFAGVLRMDRTKRGVMWIDQPPITIAGDHFFDPPVMQAEASRSGAGAATSGA